MRYAQLRFAQLRMNVGHQKYRLFLDRVLIGLTRAFRIGDKK